MKKHVKKFVLYTLLYFLAVLVVILITNTYYLRTDTANLTETAYNVEKDMDQNKSARFDDIKVEYFTKNQTDAKDLKILKDGAASARLLTRKTISVAVPRYENNQVVGYLRVTDDRTDNRFINYVFLTFAGLLYLFIFFRSLSDYRKRQDYEETLVAKIKAIYRNPTEQSYLITEETDPITKQLNRLGEKIQRQALSTKPKKENLYEFIEFFDFPIFIYNEKGSIRRANESFRETFSKSKNIDLFSNDTDFLSFLVSSLVEPKIATKEFYFTHIDAEYIVHLQPLPDLSNNILVSLQEISSFKNK